MKTFLKKRGATAKNLLMGGLMGLAFGVSPLLMGGLFAALGILMGATGMSFSGTLLASAIDIDDLVTEYGAFYKNDPDRRAKLKSKLYNTTGKFDSLFMEVPTDSTREEWGYSEHTEVLQPYQEGWTSKGDHTILPNPYKLFWAKYDLDYFPDQLVNSWAGFLRANNLSVDECPFVQYVIEEHIIPRGHQDWNDKVAFLGAYSAPTAGTPGAAGTTADGVRKLIRDHNTAGTITPISMGAPPTDPVLFCKYMEEMTALIPEQYRTMGMVWRMRDTLRLRYLEGFEELHTKFYAKGDVNVENMPIYQYPHITVQGFENMGTSNMIFASPKSNSWKLMKGSAKKEILKVETLKRQLFLFTDFHAGYWFEDPRMVFVNDQDLS